MANAYPFFQNPSMGIENPFYPTQSLNFLQHQQLTAGTAQHQFQFLPPRRPKPCSSELLQKVDRAVDKSWKDTVGSGESVSAWKVSQLALMTLQADSWESLGFRMQEVPSLHRLFVLEGKINAFVHCFVAVQRITSIYDLEEALCKSEGVHQFEELQLGPLLRHPLVLHYFSLNSNARDVCKITSEEIILDLHDFMNTCEKKKIILDELLYFMAKKRSLVGKDMLGIRIQSLGMHITLIREARRHEKTRLMKCLMPLQNGSNDGCRKRPLFASQKRLLDERFDATRRRIESFSPTADFCGKHTTFISSSSEDEAHEEAKYAEKIAASDSGSPSLFSSQLAVGSDRSSSCPYPSAIEEMSRLVRDTCLLPMTSLNPKQKVKEKENNCFTQGRKLKKAKSTISASSQLGKRSLLHNVGPHQTKEKAKTLYQFDEAQVSLSCNSINSFITTWTEACKEHNIAEVLDKMLDFYKPLAEKRSAKNKRRNKALLSAYPCIGLVNVAVASIKRGVDSFCDAPYAVGEQELTGVIPVAEGEPINAEPMESHSLAQPDHILQQMPNVTEENLIKEICEYYKLGPTRVQSCGKTPRQEQFVSMKKLCDCELKLAEKLGIGEFSSLGYGEFFFFLEKHASELPSELQALLAGDISSETSSLEVCMRQHPLVFLASQASSTVWENQKITREMISSLLRRQFPLVGFQITQRGSVETFAETVEQHRSAAMSKCVLFSATLIGAGETGVSMPYAEEYEADNPRLRDLAGSVTCGDAIEILLQAPMLSDLISWSHWETVFASSLGSLVEWLLRDARPEELLCLVTRDGKVIRIDPSARADSFLEAMLQRSPFQTAVNLLSLFSLAGGEKHLPLSLLKCYSRHAFEVLAGCQSCPENSRAVNPNELVVAASRFFLDCVCHLPSEFLGFAADVLLSGMDPVISKAPAAILRECTRNERLVLHEIGLASGIAEWAGDYRAFCSASPRNPQMPSDSSSRLEVSGPDATPVPSAKSHAEFGVESIPEDSGFDKSTSLAFLIESIRKDEFGLDSNRLDLDNILLKKQHARLGRALHCLSQELYSQDSHFLLELVQNADDNQYSGNVEPTLAFILQDAGIVVLNNEQGFTVDNIRALCDVGNSTKKGSASGYIGKKGIGFKSVFRVTNAPEIHSNGFHIKFDISEGEIGFVLPTVIPACDVGMFSSLVPEAGGMADGNKSWNTCIVLPFKSKLSEETAMNMLSDLRPSLLLFLHRLKCIVFRNALADSIVVMRKEILGDGIVKVSCGKEETTWLMASQTVQQHAHGDRPDVRSTEISIAFTLEESENGDYAPCLVQQPVFSFLPLRTYGLRFILQGDFFLPSSREDVDKNNPWNEWLLTKFPGLFVNAERSFLALSCFRGAPGRAVTAYMSFVPLVGEVHGFFSGLPRAIICELQRTSCLFLEGDRSKMVPPCNVLRNWNSQARGLLPDNLIQQHLGLGFLDRDIILADSLSAALGISEYGPETLIKFLISLCRTEGGLKSMGLSWLSSWLVSFHNMLFLRDGPTSLADRLRSIPFVPLSDGAHSSVCAGTIWFQSDALINGAYGFDAFPRLYAELRIVSPLLLRASPADETDTLTKMLRRIGVKELSAHEIVRIHVLPALSNTGGANKDAGLMTDYLCFVMMHLQLSFCPACSAERELVLSELRSSASVLTNRGYRRPIETPIHFSREYGNPIDVRDLVDAADVRWLEVDSVYLRHPVNDVLGNGLTKWREFFKQIGVVDFVKVVRTDRSLADVLSLAPGPAVFELHANPRASLVEDWESPELVRLLSHLTAGSDGERSVRLLGILDIMWDEHFCDKTHVSLPAESRSSAGSRPFFRSSFLRSICDSQWLASTMDDELHYAKDLFHDCDAVRSILGDFAPYATPMVKSAKLVVDIGFKTKVTINDILEFLLHCHKCETSFKASLSQMSKLYKCMGEEMTASKDTVIQETLRSRPFIFIPYNSLVEHEDVVPGVFLPSDEVYWCDPTGAVDQMEVIYQQCTSGNDSASLLSKKLCRAYPGLREFFVSKCAVHEIPSYHSYLDIMCKLSVAALPSEAANAVFRVFLRWSDELKSGYLSSDDVLRIRDHLARLDCTVLPTVHDKWVSLHPSFGLICWDDDRKLRQRFEDLENVWFLYFGSICEDENNLLLDKVSVLMQALGIPALSEIVTREAIYYGPSDSKFIASLVNWVLPFAQRYIFNSDPDNYFQLRKTEFCSLMQLQIVVVEKLFYRNVIKSCGAVSHKRYECTSLLQGTVLYATANSDSHAVFMELTRLFFNGNPQLHLANFLHIIATMAESGSTMEQIESFAMNSQKVPPLPEEEYTWSLSSSSKDELLHIPAPKTNKSQHGEKEEDEEEVVDSRKRLRTRSSNWQQPEDWKTAPGFNYARENGFRTYPPPARLHPDPIRSLGNENEGDDNNEVKLPAREEVVSVEAGAAWSVNYDWDNFNDRDAVSRLDLDHDEATPNLFSDLTVGAGGSERALQIGRLGEQIAFKYLSQIYGRQQPVGWANEEEESGLPYDIVVGGEKSPREFVEVKSTRYGNRNWFVITVRELQFALKMGESFSVAYVVLGRNRTARIRMFRNLRKLCHDGSFQLAVVMHGKPNEESGAAGATVDGTDPYTPAVSMCLRY